MTDHTRTRDESANALPMPELVSGLAAIIGKKLTAYAGRANDTRVIDLWTEDDINGLDKPTEERLRFLYSTVMMLREYDAPAVIRAWLIGMNTELDDRSALSVPRNKPLEIAAPLILSAARVFAVEG